MDAQDPPDSFGVLKPEGHAVLAWPDAESADAALGSLREAGLDAGGVQRWTPQAMQALARQQLEHAETAAHFGYEINLVREYGQLAERGCHFAAVRCGDDAATARLQRWAQDSGAVAAQAYGRWMHQDLLSHPGGPTSGERLDAANGEPTEPTPAEPPSIVDDPVAQLAPGHHPARRVAEARARAAETAAGSDDPINAPRESR